MNPTLKDVIKSLLMICLLYSNTAIAQEVRYLPDAPTLLTSDTRGTSEVTTAIDVDKISKSLRQAPIALDVRSSTTSAKVTIPIGGNLLEFSAVENTTMSQEYKEAMPDVRSYTLEYGDVRGRMTVSPSGINAYLFTKEGMIAIYPTVAGQSDRHTIDYGIVDHGHEHTAMCTHTETEDDLPMPKMTPELKAAVADVSNGGTLREYRLAIVCTGEFYQANGNSVTPVNAAITATVDAMNEIFMRDVSFRFTLLTPRLNNNPATDPFTPDNMGGEGRTTQAGIAVGNAFNINAYDVGHVFHNHSTGDGWSGGGVAQLRSVCGDFVSSSGSVTKARGWSGSFNNTTVGWIQLASHEFGHMYNCPHTFNGSGSSCDDAISESTAYEIASGTTIMSYNGICSAAQNIPQSGNDDSYFHSNSLLRMIAFINDNGNCPPQSNVDNTPPEIEADPCGLAGNFTIPRQTPFILRGEGSDAEGDMIDYIWEQYDEDGANSTSTQGFIGVQAASSDRAPLFRSFPPSPTGNERYFPSRQLVLDGEFDQFEVLPRRERTLHFQLVARDNNPLGGGVALQEIEVPVSGNGPLEVTSPNAASAFTSGDATTVTWSTGGSDDLCAQVDVLLSIDGGVSFSYTLAQGVNYDAGMANVTIPGSVVNTEDAKIMVQCSDNTCIQFYNVSDGVFTIESDCLAESVRVCSKDAVVFNQGDPGLDLDLTAILGVPFSSLLTTVTADDEAFLYPASNTATGGCRRGFQSTFKAFRFVSQETETHRLFIDDFSSVQISVHTADNFVANNSCASLVASSFTYDGSNFFRSSSLEIPVEACREYIMLVIRRSSGGTGGFDSSSPAVDFIAVAEADPDYNSTFIAVDESGIIRWETPTSDFTSTPSGIYEVYAVNYKAAGAEPPTIVDPSTWVGQSLTTIFGGDNCFTLSPESKPMEIISTCQVLDISAGAQTACNPVDNTYDQTLTITYDLPPTGDLEVTIGSSTQTFPVTGSPQEVTLTDLQSDGSEVDVLATFVENRGCVLEATAVYTAPVNCCALSVDIPEAVNACQDSMVVLDAGSDGATYQWALDGTALVETGNTLAVADAGVYTVTVTTAGGCAKPDETVVTFFDNPSTFLIVDDTVACDGSTILLTLETDGTEVEWFRDGTVTNGISLTQLEATETGLYSAVASNIAGCESEESQFIQFNPTPMVELGDNQQVCGGSPVTLDASTAAGNYIWFRDGTVIVGENGQTLDVQESGMYSVVAEGGGGCDDQDMVNIEIFDLPSITLATDTAICAGTPVTLFTNPQNVDNFTFTRDGTELTIPDLSAIVVASAGEYTLTVENEIGCPVSRTLTVVENELPVVELDPERVGCEGSSVLLTSPTTGASYSWVFNGQEISTDDNVMVTQEGVYQLSVSDALGCVGSDEIAVTFVPGPTLSIDGDQSICAGDNSTLVATTSGDNIQWSLDGVDIAGATDTELMVTEPGIYRAAVSGASGCLVEDQIEVVVNPLPTVDAGDNVTLCDGESIDRMVSATGPMLAYSWTRDGQAVAGGESILLEVAGSYTVVVTDENGCSAESNIDVAVSDLPTVSASSDMLDICDGIGEEVTLTTDGTSVTWLRDGMVIAGATSTTFNIDTDGEYTAIVANDAGCENSVVVTATSRPSPTVDLGDDLTLCPGESIPLDAGADASSTVSWSTGSTSNTITVTNPDLDDTTTDIISVTVTNQFDCANSDEIEVTFRPVVMAMIDGPIGVCPGETATLIASGGIDYVWTDPSGTLSNTDQAQVIASPTTSTEYTVQVSDECPGNVDEVMVTVVVFDPSTDATAGPDTTVVAGQSVNLSASGGIAYAWSADPTLVGGSTATPAVSPTVPTTYTVTITDQNGCTVVDSVQVDINDDPLAAFLAVNLLTPNDDGDNDVLLFKGLEAFPDNSLRIYNRWGAVLFEKVGYQITGTPWDGTRNGELLPADTYYYVLEIDGRTIKSALTILRD